MKRDGHRYFLWNQDVLVLGVNLLFISPGFRGGTKRYVQGLIEAIAALGRCKIILFVQKEAFRLEMTYPNVTYYELPAMTSPSRRVLVEQLRLPFLVRQAGVDVLYSPGFVVPVLAGCPQVVTVHDLFFQKFPSLVRSNQRIYLRFFVGVSLRVAKLITVVSETTGRDVAKAFPGVQHKLLAILPGVPTLTNVTLSAKRNDRPVVLFVGYITPIKNIAVLLVAMKLLLDRNIRCCLKVIGSDMFGLLRREMAACGLPAELVDYTENATDEQLAQAYQTALCTVMPSLYEGFGLPVLEAMAYGCPVIISGEGALREVANDAALYFSVSSPPSLADAIVGLINDEGLRDDLRRRGLENCGRFSWQASAARMMSEIEQLKR